MRVVIRRTPRSVGAQVEVHEDPCWLYGAFATNTAAGQAQTLDARHRTQAHVEDKIKELKAFGARNLPSKDWDRNAELAAARRSGGQPHRLAAAPRPRR